MGFQLSWRDVFLLVGLGSVILLARFGLDEHRVLVGEGAAFLAMGLLFWRHARVRATLRSLDPVRRALVVLLPVFLVAGHVVRLHDRPYPFVTWELYTTSLPANPSYHEYTGTLPTGREITLPLRALFPSLGGRVGVLLEIVSARALHAREGRAREQAAVQLGAILRAAAREYERRYAQGPIRAVDVWHRTIPTTAYGGRASIARHLERRVETP